MNQCAGVSAAQEALWFGQRLAPDVPNNISTHLEIFGPVDHRAMAAAVRQVCLEAQTLRVTFTECTDGLRQTLRDPDGWELDFFDLSGSQDPEYATVSLISEMTRRAFDLGHDILFRAGLIKLDESRHSLFIVAHHIVCDGFGLLVAARRIAEVYTALKSGVSPSRPKFCSPEVVAADDYSYRCSESFLSDKAFWDNHTRSWPEPLNIGEPPTSRQPATLHQGLTLAGADALGLRRAAKHVGVSMPRFLAASLAGCFSRAATESEFPIRLSSANRIGVAWSTPCLLANAVPARVNVAAGVGFKDFAQSLDREISEVLTHGRYHISEIQRDTCMLRRQRNRFGPIFNILPFFGDLRFAQSHAAFRGASFGACDDLAISAYYDGRQADDEDGTVHIQIDANGLLYAEADLRRFTDQLRSYLHAVTADPDRRMDRIEIISAAERDQVLVRWNDTATAIPLGTIPELFAAQAARTPGAPAVEDENEVFTYRELDSRADDLAARLQHRGAGPETIVAVALPRSAQLVTVLLAISKAGAAYLPIDPNYPSERTAYILADAAARLLVTDTATAAMLPDTDAALLILDADRPDTIGCGALDCGDGGAPAVPDNLAYVMYTSGSTGRPKAVAITHRNVVALFAGLMHRCRFAGADVWAWCHSPAFDFSVWELWGPLLHGAKVVVVPWETVRSPHQLWQLIVDKHITVLSQTPSAFYELMRAERESSSPADKSALRMVVFGGEALDPSRLRGWYPDECVGGYNNSKWAGEVLLREANDQCGLPVAVFRCAAILTHTKYAGQLNLPDLFTRLILSLVTTGLAPYSFYELDADGERQRSHFDGLPVDFIAEAITTLGERVRSGVETYNVVNPYDDGIGLDQYVDWLAEDGRRIERIDDNGEWLQRFRATLQALPAQQREHTLLPLLHYLPDYERPELPLNGAPASGERFRAAVQEAKIGPDKDIPHVSASVIVQYIRSLQLIGLA